MCNVVVDPVGICDNDINQPLQIIVEESDKILPAPRIIRFYIGTLRAIPNDKASMFPVRNTNRPGIPVSDRGNMESPRLHRVKRKPVRKERLPTAVLARSNQLLGIASFFRHWPRYRDIEETSVSIVAHYSQPLEPMLNLNQSLKHIAINDNLQMLPFTQRLHVRGILACLLRQIGEEPSIYNLPFIHLCVCSLNFNKLARIKFVHQVFIFKNISHLVADYMSAANLSVDVGMRMPVNLCIDPTVGNQISVFTGKCTV